LTDSACTVYCKQTSVPQGTFYCDQPTLKWKKCTDADCTENAFLFNGTNSAHAFCYNDKPMDGYCELPN
jgi:hypothetical protein